MYAGSADSRTFAVLRAKQAKPFLSNRPILPAQPELIALIARLGCESKTAQTQHNELWATGSRLSTDATDCGGGHFLIENNCKTVEQAMSVRKLTAGLLTALALLGGVTKTHAQQHVPVADPFEFDPDFHWFEPVYEADLIDMKPKKRAATGWFATYDRLNLYTSRPELDAPPISISEVRVDSGWGHRYEVGYMLPDDDTGFVFNWTSNGVGAFNQLRRERLNRVNLNDLAGTPDNPGPPFGFGEPAAERNNLGYNTRFYDITDTENLVNFDSYELNKTWRLEPYHYGGILEPLVGLRWMRIRDTNGNQVYTSSLDGNLALADSESLLTNTAITKNEMFGGNLGFRYFKFRDRFTFNAEFKAFFGGSWQNTRASVHEVITSYDATGTDAQVVSIITREPFDPRFARNETFMVGFDVKGSVGYQLTKQVSIRAGFQVIDVARGVWRGGNGDFIVGGSKDQDLLMFGGTFGINLNH